MSSLDTLRLNNKGVLAFGRVTMRNRGFLALGLIVELSNCHIVELSNCGTDH